MNNANKHTHALEDKLTKLYFNLHIHINIRIEELELSKKCNASLNATMVNLFKLNLSNSQKSTIQKGLERDTNNATLIQKHELNAKTQSTLIIALEKRHTWDIVQAVCNIIYLNDIKEANNDALQEVQDQMALMRQEAETLNTSNAEILTALNAKNQEILNQISSHENYMAFDRVKGREVSYSNTLTLLHRMLYWKKLILLMKLEFLTIVN